MTIIELQEVLAERIRLACDKDGDQQERAKEVEYSLVVSNLAKQFINAADVTLRTEKLIGEDKLKENGVTAKLLGHPYGK